MTDRMNLEERFEAMAARLERAERANRGMKLWALIAFAAVFALGSGTLASAGKISKKVVAEEFDLVTSSGKPLATLVPFKGGAQLLFLSGSTVRTTVGFDPTDGGGVGSFDSNGKLRTQLGTDPTGSGPNGLLVYDANEKPRIGVSQSASLGNSFFLFDTDGKTLRAAVASDNAGSVVGVNLFDATGMFRNGINYDPTTHFFNGFSSADGSGHALSLIGNVLATTGILSANDSVMELLDTSTPRVFEFENSTNEGGADFDAGKFPTTQGGWGNP